MYTYNRAVPSIATEVADTPTTGAFTLLAMELIARKKWQGWLVGLLNQFLWFGLIFSQELWGLLPLTVLLTWRFAATLIR